MTPTGDSENEHPSHAEQTPDPEVHILGSIMKEPVLLKDIASRIKPEFFQRELHSRVYRAMLYKDMYGHTPTLQSLSLEARPYGLLENVDKRTLNEMARRTSTIACIDESVKAIIERYKQQELDQVQEPGTFEKHRDASRITETLIADLDDAETGHGNLTTLDTRASQLSRSAIEPPLAHASHRQAPTLAPSSRRPQVREDRAHFQVAKPLALATLIVGAGLLAWFAGLTLPGRYRLN